MNRAELVAGSLLTGAVIGTAAVAVAASVDHYTTHQSVCDHLSGPSKAGYVENHCGDSLGEEIVHWIDDYKKAIGLVALVETATVNVSVDPASIALQSKLPFVRRRKVIRYSNGSL